MKTTLELDDTLLRQAAIVAAKRGTTLNAIMEHALRRELAPASEDDNPNPEKFEIGPLGFFVLKRNPGESITAEEVRTLQRDLDANDLHRAVHLRLA